MNTAKKIDFGMYEKQAANKGSGILPVDIQATIADIPLFSMLREQLSKKSIVYWRSNGEWSMHQLLLQLIDIIGPADVYISSYAFGETPARIIANLKEKGLIKSLHCLLDDRVESRTAGSMQLISSIADSFATTMTHAKVTLLKNDLHTVSVVGSANYTENKRWEAGVIDNNPDIFSFYYEFITKAINGRES